MRWHRRPTQEAFFPAKNNLTHLYSNKSLVYFYFPFTVPRPTFVCLELPANKDHEILLELLFFLPTFFSRQK
jgi:hypothetical protein